jgi:hypothetical protein
MGESNVNAGKMVFKKNSHIMICDLLESWHQAPETLHLLHVRLSSIHMPPRKRKRDQAFVDEVEAEVNLTLNEEQRAEKEQEIWDAIRETHYEGKLQNHLLKNIDRMDLNSH